MLSCRRRRLRNLRDAGRAGVFAQYVLSARERNPPTLEGLLMQGTMTR